jgi:hypothetical protein
MRLPMLAEFAGSGFPAFESIASAMGTNGQMVSVDEKKNRVDLRKTKCSCYS